jgi:hypothetical protein
MYGCRDRQYEQREAIGAEGGNLMQQCREAGEDKQCREAETGNRSRGRQ